MAILMVAVFAALLISELGSSHNDFGFAHKGSSLSSYRAASDSAPLNGNGDSCSDPCHAGVCHFGHCTHLVLHSQSFAFINVLGSSWIQANSTSLLSPYLDPWKRPPRFGLLV